jgi:hypothetical protein
MHWDNKYNRLVPDAGPEQFVTHKVSAPIHSHWRPATCEEFECDDFVYGFVFTCDTSTELGQSQYYYLTHDRSRRYSMQRVGPQMVKFVYGPGFRGFGNAHASHRVPIGRPPLYLVAEGDFRGNPRGVPTRVHRNVEDFVDHSWSHFDKLKTIYERG